MKKYENYVAEQLADEKLSLIKYEQQIYYRKIKMNEIIIKIDKESINR